MNYYNEYDPKAAAWLRELIRAGEIPAGDVDERSITEISPHELTRYTQHHFFAGIGGWPLALRLAGWPENRPVRTGSCPCQPFSDAGKQLGTADPRHLWPVFRDLITFGEPATAFGEQVASALGREWLAGVRADLEGVGYAVGAADLCAASAGAPHIRQRLFWVAHPAGKRRHGPHARKESAGRAIATRSGYAGGLADTDRNGCAQHEHESGERRAAGPSDSAERGGLAGRMDYAEKLGCESRRLRGSSAERPAPAQSPGPSDACGVGDTHLPRPQGRDERGNRADQWTPWAASVALACTDGRSRRTEPGTFPLAHGISGRVGLLRGYGNAIVPQVAAFFVTAYLEATEPANPELTGAKRPV